MIQRNIHGEWAFTFEGRLMTTKLVGQSNREASLAWFKDMKSNLLSSPESDRSPWVLLFDCTEWLLGPEDIADTNNKIMTWMTSHNLVFEAAVFSYKLQEFAIDQQDFDTKSVLHYFYDYDEAYQACLNKLADFQR
ncbi:hypothetical protein L4C34_19975 [Vibrio profundum]|uniref:hypothetical protein n=1 Tax=Vibrio profundum TaxID=2910247 RepID=UPI003D0D44E8